MDPLVLATVTTGLGIAAVIGTQNWRYNRITTKRLDDMSNQINKLESSINTRMEKIEIRIGELDKQVSHLDGLMEGLRESIAGRRVA